MLQGDGDYRHRLVSYEINTFLLVSLFVSLHPINVKTPGAQTFLMTIRVGLLTVKFEKFC